MFDGRAFGAEMVEIVRQFVAAELEPLRADNKALVDANADLADRVAELESRAAVEPVKGEPGEPGRDGIDGKDTDPEYVKQVVRDILTFELPPPPGPPGAAGEVDMDAVRELVDQATQKAVSEQVPAAVAALPPAEKGDPGRNGADCDMDAVKHIIIEQVTTAVSSIPLPQKGDPGKDGVGLADALIDRDGGLVLTLTDGSTKALGLVVGKDGKDGEDGKQGETFTLDDFDIEQISERAFKFKFTKGEVCHSFEFSLPVVLDAGVWNEAKTYVQGDAVSWAGSLWIAQRDAPGKPDTADSGWRLSVKKGQRGKDADMNDVKALATEQARNAVAAMMKEAAK